MNITSRIAPVQLSCERIDNQTVRAKYNAGYGFCTVTSKFNGDKSLCDLFYEMIIKKQNVNFHPGQHDPSTQNAPFMV
jgi:hypothetical protein